MRFCSPPLLSIVTKDGDGDSDHERFLLRNMADDVLASAWPVRGPVKKQAAMTNMPTTLQNVDIQGLSARSKGTISIHIVVTLTRTGRKRNLYPNNGSRKAGSQAGSKIQAGIVCIVGRPRTRPVPSEAIFRSADMRTQQPRRAIANKRAQSKTNRQSSANSGMINSMSVMNTLNSRNNFHPGSRNDILSTVNRRNNQASMNRNMNGAGAQRSLIERNIASKFNQSITNHPQFTQTPLNVPTSMPMMLSSNLPTQHFNDRTINREHTQHIFDASIPTIASDPSSSVTPDVSDSIDPQTLLRMMINEIDVGQPSHSIRQRNSAPVCNNMMQPFSFVTDRDEINKSGSHAHHQYNVNEGVAFDGSGQSSINVMKAAETAALEAVQCGQDAALLDNMPSSMINNNTIGNNIHGNNTSVNHFVTLDEMDMNHMMNCADTTAKNHDLLLPHCPDVSQFLDTADTGAGSSTMPYSNNDTDGNSLSWL